MGNKLRVEFGGEIRVRDLVEAHEKRHGPLKKVLSSSQPSTLNPLALNPEHSTLSAYPSNKSTREDSQCPYQTLNARHSTRNCRFLGAPRILSLTGSGGGMSQPERRSCCTLRSPSVWKRACLNSKRGRGKGEMASVTPQALNPNET